MLYTSRSEGTFDNTRLVMTKIDPSRSSVVCRLVSVGIRSKWAWEESHRPSRHGIVDHHGGDENS